MAQYLHMLMNIFQMESQRLQISSLFTAQSIIAKTMEASKLSQLITYPKLVPQSLTQWKDFPKMFMKKSKRKKRNQSITILISIPKMLVSWSNYSHKFWQDTIVMHQRHLALTTFTTWILSRKSIASECMEIKYLQLPPPPMVPQCFLPLHSQSHKILICR